MNILAFVDLHGSRKAFEMLAAKAKEADLLLCAGDISLWGKGLENIFAYFNQFKKPMLIIHGNHEEADEMEGIAKKFDFVIFLHKASYEIGDYVFFGFGGGGFALENKEIERITKKLLESIKEGKKVITFSHGPPYGTALDFLSGAGHRGCESTRRLIEEIKPVAHVCGHLHENAGKQDLIENTVLINPGATGVILEI